MDSNGDGVGDFKGLTQRLDYLADLGITCLWLLPFYPSPNQDDGYDVADYCAIDPRFGTVDDFRAFVREAERWGMRVMIDLVVQHTSNQHPWFRASRTDPTSKFSNYYIWSKRPYPINHVIFPGKQQGNWTYNTRRNAYYRHYFYPVQPDLNLYNPEVQEEVYRIISFWLDLGISGFRLDAVPFLIDPKGIEGIEIDDPHDLLRGLRDFLNHKAEDAAYMAEVSDDPDHTVRYFGKGDEMHMVTNFPMNQYLLLALVLEEAGPLNYHLEQLLPPLPATCQWANFLRNHDELNLDKLRKQDRESIFNVFAPEQEMRIYGRGIRRRLASMLGGDRRRIELAHSLLLSVPGTPILYYGDEIGMAENLSLPGRLSVRTPMQWSSERNGGFSTAPAAELVRPMNREFPYSYRKVNVAAQQRDPTSLCNWVKKALKIRRSCLEIGGGDWRVFDAGDSAVLAVMYRREEGVVVTLHNFSNESRTASLDLSEHRDRRVVDLFGGRTYRRPREGVHRIRLGPYGYRWLRALPA